MKKRILGNTNIEISPVGLGCMGLSHAFGTPLEKADAAEKIQAAYDMGYTFFDTANTYARGTSEEFLGRALKDMARRNEIALATKVHFPMGEGKNCRGLSRNEIMYEVDQSLKRLGAEEIAKIDSLPDTMNPPVYGRR